MGSESSCAERITAGGRRCIAIGSLDLAEIALPAYCILQGTQSCVGMSSDSDSYYCQYADNDD